MELSSPWLPLNEEELSAYYQARIAKGLHCAPPSLGIRGEGTSPREQPPSIGGGLGIPHRAFPTWTAARMHRSCSRTDKYYANVPMASVVLSSHFSSLSSHLIFRFYLSFPHRTKSLTPESGAARDEHLWTNGRLATAKSDPTMM